MRLLTAINRACGGEKAARRRPKNFSDSRLKGGFCSGAEKAAAASGSQKKLRRARKGRILSNFQINPAVCAMGQDDSLRRKIPFPEQNLAGTAAVGELALPFTSLALFPMRQSTLFSLRIFNIVRHTYVLWRILRSAPAV